MAVGVCRPRIHGPLSWACVSLSLLAVLTCVGAQLSIQGSWDVLTENAGIASMHTAITRYGHAVLLDRFNEGPTQIDLTSNECLKIGGNKSRDCTAHSVVFIPEGEAVRPLTIRTDTWCSSGQFGPNGTLIQTGGEGNGSRMVRLFNPCPPGGNCDWVEVSSPSLLADRWYSTNQILPDGRMIIVGGLDTPTIEYIPDRGEGLVSFPFLSQNKDSNGDNLYPFVHLLPDGNLFIFANKASIIYNYVNNTIVKTLPNITGESRNYPSAGSSVLLPLTLETQFNVADILVCGGADFRAFKNASGQFSASDTCGRIRVTDAAPAWVMETMPVRRCMGDMILLPTGGVLIINGAQVGAQGFNNAFQPALSPVLYQPSAPEGVRFTTLSPTTRPRMYHSTANLLPDGRVMVAGSNPHAEYTFFVGNITKDGVYPTDLSLEAFSPPYLSGSLATLKPNMIQVPMNMSYGRGFIVIVEVQAPVVGNIFLSLVNAPFSTHSFAQGQRLLSIGATSPIDLGNGRYQIASLAPPNANVAPPGYYMLFAINQGVPSVGAWVLISN